MWRRPVVTILTLIIAVVLTLPVSARQKNVGPSGAGPGPNAVRPYVACAGAMPALPPRAQQKPFTQEQVSNMVRDGFGDDSGAKLIEQRGIDFAPSEDFYQNLKAAGASEAFVNALRAANPPEPASAKKPLNQVQVFALLAGQVPSHRVTMLVEERGIDFEPSDDYLQEVRLAGGEDELIGALKTARVTKSVTIDPAAQVRQVQLRQHVARGAELEQKKQYAEAEQEFRAALLFDPENPDLYASLGLVLDDQKKWDDAAASYREALRLDPNYEMAHVNLGVALEHGGDLDGNIAEEREALRLDPSDETAYFNLGVALEKKHDWEGAMREYKEALRRNPNDDGAHVGLGHALRGKGDLDGAIGEYRAALHVNPNNESTHNYLGIALGGQRDWDGAIAEFREALRLNPNFAEAHSSIGFALVVKGDLDGAIAELREALRLDPNNGGAHFGLGNTLERKGDRRGALEEYRTAYKLDPKNAQFRQAYERLLRDINGQ